MPHRFKLGRKSRTFNPAIPHMSSLMPALRLRPPPPSVDYLADLPDDVGMMLNDQLGDCTCAAIYHAIQVWTMKCSSTGMQTNPDEFVELIYQKFCGYRPDDPNTDQGGIEQKVLHRWFKLGVPVADGGLNCLEGVIEVDPRNRDDVKRTIDQCGVCYIGFEVPSNILPDDGSDPPMLWEVASDAHFMGGHAVVLGSYDEENVGLISWGNPRYKMTWDFFHRYTQEAYALADPDWRDATGMTPLGMDKAQLWQLMRAMRAAG